MKHLKEYIVESLLDDDDTIMANAHREVFKGYINQLNDIIKAQNHYMGGDHVELVENSLMFKTPFVSINQKMAALIIEFRKVVEFDEIWGDGEIEFNERGDLLDGKVIKTFRCKKVTIKYATRVSDVDFCLENYSTAMASKFVFEYGNPIMTNVNIYMDGQNFGDRMRFLEWPSFKNVQTHGVKSLQVYSPSIFDEIEVKKALNNFIDPTYEYSIEDSKKGRITRKGDLRNLVATVNNPKRYLVDTADDIMFSIQKSSKLKDLIDVTKFDKDLEWVSILNNGVGIYFRRKGSKLNFLSGEPHINLFMNLPNDPEWEMIVAHNR